MILPRSLDVDTHAGEDSSRLFRETPKQALGIFTSWWRRAITGLAIAARRRFGVPSFSLHTVKLRDAEVKVDEAVDARTSRLPLVGRFINAGINGIPDITG